MLQVVRICDGQLTKRDLRPINGVRGPLVVRRDIARLGHGGLKLIAHRNVLRVVKSMPPKRRHTPNVVEITLHIQGNQRILPSIVIPLHSTERIQPVHTPPAIRIHPHKLRRRRVTFRIVFWVAVRVTRGPDHGIRDVVRADRGEDDGVDALDGVAGAVDVSVVTVKLRLGFDLLDAAKCLHGIHEAGDCDQVDTAIRVDVLDAAHLLQRVAHLLLAVVAAERDAHLHHG